MNTQKRIERCLRAAPKPPAQDSLLDKLQKDVALGEINTRRSALQRLFVPTGGRISLWRVAAAATFAIAVLLPLSYGAVKAVKHFVFEDQVTFEYPEDNTAYTVGRSISGYSTNNEEDVRKELEEFKELYREGKAKEVKPGIWEATLSNDEEFAYEGNPEGINVEFTEEEKEQLKKQFDEINELRRAGKYERTFIKEIEVDELKGVKFRQYKDRFTLSNGKVITLTISEEEPAKDEVEQ
jgi:hypothetical protein